MNLAESIAAILAMHEGRMLRARVALLELAEYSDCQFMPDDLTERIRAIARELAAPTREPGACPNHPAAETLEIVSCVVCGAWKPSKDSPLVYIGSDGVHRAVRNSPTSPAPAPYDGPAWPFPDHRCPAEWREDDGELAHCDLKEGHAGAHRYRNVFEPPPSEKASEDSLSAKPGGNPAERAGENGPSDTSAVFSEGGAEKAEIEAAHPLRSGRHDLYAEAMRLVGARRSKGDLVDLVTWLLFKCDAAQERRQVVEWLRSDQGIGGDDMVAKTIADSIEHGEHVLWAHAVKHPFPAAVGKASVPDQKITVAAAAENKAAATPESPPLSVQRCTKCGRERPTYIADPSCVHAGYCDWQPR